MNYAARDYHDAARALRAHGEDCDECRELGKNGDVCPEGARLMKVARHEYECLRDPPDDDRDAA